MMLQDFKKIVFGLLSLMIVYTLPNQASAETELVFAEKAYANLFKTKESSQKHIDEFFNIQFDFEEFSKRCFSDIAKKMTDNQKSQLTKKFKDLFVLSLKNKSNTFYKNRILNPSFFISEKLPKASVVKIMGKTQDGTDLTFLFYLHKKPQGWQVFDFSIKNALASRNYKGSFNRVFREHEFSGLLQKLDEKINSQ